MKCPHVAKSELVGDEWQWCVVCLRKEVKRLNRVVDLLRKDLGAAKRREHAIAEVQREACVNMLATLSTSLWVSQLPEVAVRNTPLVTDVKYGMTYEKKIARKMKR